MGISGLVSARKEGPLSACLNALRAFHGCPDPISATQAIERGVYALNEAEFSVSHTPHCEELMYGR
jgi:hypothetical protein